MEHVILVDQEDNVLGSMEKMEAHRKGVLHRAFSVVLFNSKGEVLLQKRSKAKYHSAGRWTNTCCSHPRPGEPIAAAVSRRLQEEMGIDMQLVFAYKFLYRAVLENDLIEHELDHVYVGRFDGEPAINLAEVESWRYAAFAAIRQDVLQNPDSYTPWFKLMLNHPQLETARISLL